ncbi:monocarboxylate permease [Aspergillus brunneoviolaceus CBS 621.78]|uniref:Monocarboxylate permease n=1 Tax=Aspergillus brunneoviolaceus CBS 621.78 TaxID=1450534 RepID=A0ACD1GAJ9_9EURO|nr:monocarboxylate permease [Aspergillus brunneoviolaceus CBS 621.78]RAH46159.1 monocarboxylate permease [Aspergillus brunneoviolaceus CBS 621.78]
MNWTDKPLRALARPPSLGPGPNPEGSAPLPPPPDGGLQAWTQVLCMHFVFFNSWGVSNSFSVFEQLYTATLPQSASTISWIGSVQVSLLFFAGAVVGRATDAGYFRLVFALGVFLQLLGVFLLSLAKTYWQIFLTQAVCMGLGNGLTFSPGLSIMASYFVERRAFAVGVAAAGAATGGLIYPVLVNQLLYTQQIGFGWTIRAAGLLMLVTQMPGVVLFQPRLPPRRTGPLIEWGAFTERPFLFFTASMFLNFWGLYFAFFYLGTFARDRLGVTDTQDLILVLNGVGIVGRVGPSLVGDRLGKLNVLVPLSFASAIVILCWMAVDTVAGLYVFAVVYGLVGGAAQSLFPATATTMTPDIKRTGTRIGMILSIVGFATLTGPVLEGALISRVGGSYIGAQIFAGVCVVLGAGAALAARVAKVGWEWGAKA